MKIERGTIKKINSTRRDTVADVYVDDTSTICAAVRRVGVYPAHIPAHIIDRGLLMICGRWTRAQLTAAVLTAPRYHEFFN